MKTKFKYFLALLVMGFSFVAQTQTLDQTQLVYQGAHSARNLPGFSTWQSFTAGITGTLSQIDNGFASTMNGTATLNMYNGTGLEGTLLHSQEVTISGTNNFWQTFTISSPVAVVAEQVYTFELIPTQGGGLPDPFGIQIGGPEDTYPRGRSSFSPTWDYVFRTFVTESLGIENYSTNHEYIKIYPNPFSTQTTLEIVNHSKNAMLTLYNAIGQKVIQMDNLNGDRITINRDNLPSGLYFVHLSANNKTLSVNKLIITEN
ncbi:T9SS type A sorting domain-containing protein [Flavobacterium sp.]|uniref:T9SS type A sorting domain-containing protein n=1 Tax=Flavobacterium sp. TaxID=239 RepID=UPI002601EA00|nr:T9SS type A sorting domain-containing protein [Flavobacterium sp.]MDD2987171.1 T9SS type A sorting domain-containing protein [Flavobacterium sp.]